MLKIAKRDLRRPNRNYKKKDIYKFHGDIVPYYELGVQDAEKDSDIIRNMKALIRYRHKLQQSKFLDDRI